MHKKLPLLILTTISITIFAGELDFRIQMKRSMDFMCNTPRRRSISLHTLLEEEGLESDAKYSPPSVVLHKCDSQSGCCLAESHVCSPVNSESVKVWVKKIKFGNGRESRELFSVDAVNHTSCMCKHVSEIAELWSVRKMCENRSEFVIFQRWGLSVLLIVDLTLTRMLRVEILWLCVLEWKMFLLNFYSSNIFFILENVVL